MTDLDVRAAVLAALEQAPELNCTAIGVIVRAGVVTLLGRVESFAEKAAASRLVQRTQGHRRLANEIDVGDPDESCMADEVIAARVVDFLRTTGAAGGLNAKVEVNHGWVHLSGSVDRTDRRDAIERYVRLGDGVLGVENRLHLRRMGA